MFGVNSVDLKDEEFDQDMFGEYTGAGVIFGASGGVMEAALRTDVDVLTNQDLDNIEYHSVRGQRGLKEATLQVGDLKVNVAVAHSMTIAKPLLEEIKAGTSKYHFIEIMGCPGGCINGGGQSYVNALIRNSGFDFKGARAKALYDEDRAMPARKSHKNTQIQKLYDEFLEHPNSHVAHELLHTTYHKQKKFK